MAVLMRGVQVAANTVGETQDVTISGFGTPKAAIVVVSYGITNGTINAGSQYSLGFTDFTNTRCLSVRASNNQASTVIHNIPSNDRILNIFQASGTGIQGIATLASITDGVRFSWSSFPGGAVQMQVIMLSGSDLSAFVGQWDGDGTADNVTEITGVGFEADTLMAMGLDTAIDNGVNEAVSTLSVGFCDNGVGITQSCVHMGWQHNESSGDTASVVTNNRILQDASGNNLRESAEITAFDADGFDSTARGSSSVYNDCCFLALKFGGKKKHWVGNFDSLTSDGNASITGVGFRPSSFIKITSLNDTINTFQETAAVSGGWGFSSIDSNTEMSISVSDKVGSATTVTNSVADVKSTYLLLDDGTALFTSTNVSFDADGITDNFTATNSTARKWFGFALGGTPPTITTLTPLDNATDVAVDQDLIIVFSEAVNIGAGNILIKRTIGDTTFQTIDVTSGNVTGGGTDTITITHNSLENGIGIEYYINIADGCFVGDLGGVFAGISDMTTWSFTTTAGDDVTLGQGISSHLGIGLHI